MMTGQYANSKKAVEEYEYLRMQLEQQRKSIEETRAGGARWVINMQDGIVGRRRWSRYVG